MTTITFYFCQENHTNVTFTWQKMDGFYFSYFLRYKKKDRSLILINSKYYKWRLVVQKGPSTPVFFSFGTHELVLGVFIIWALSC
jgi:hypothetical protein